METVERFGVSMNPRLLVDFDELIARRGYSNRSEALRDIIRNYIIESQWETGDTEVIGTVTIVFDHHAHDLSDSLADLQHDHYSEIICTTHVHLDAHNCLETVVMRGTAEAVRSIGERLISTKGVKHGKLVCTTTGKDIA